MRKRITIVAMLVALLMSMILSACSQSALNQQGFTVFYNGMQYDLYRESDFVAKIDTSDFKKIGYAKSSVIRYLAVYAKAEENPEYLVFADGEHVYFASGYIPQKLETEYVRFSIKKDDSTDLQEFDYPFTPFEEICSQPNTYARDSSEKDQYVYVAQLNCFLCDPPNTYFIIGVYEKDGTYYLCEHGPDTDAEDFVRYYAINEDSQLYMTISDVLDGI